MIMSVFQKLFRNDTNIRCACGARMDKLRENERTYKQTANALSDFTDINIHAIDKTTAEVRAMSAAAAILLSFFTYD